MSVHVWLLTFQGDAKASGANAFVGTAAFILEWTTSLDTSSSTLFVCRGPGTGDCVQRDLSPTSGYTGISARRRYANFFYLQSVPTRSLSTLVG